MNLFVQEIAKQLGEHIGWSEEDIAAAIEIPPDPKMGDYGFPCFPLAKTLRKSPAAIATDLAEKVEPGDLIRSARGVGPYLNVEVRRDRLTACVLGEILNQRDRYGTWDTGQGKTVAIDFSSPNIAKPIGIHHIRTTAIGHSLYRIYEAMGYRCVGINHLGDWGTQFGTVIVAYRQWGNERDLEASPIRYLLDLYVRFNDEAEREPSLRDEARAWFKRLEDGDEEATRWWRSFRDLSLSELKRLYERMSIQFDYYWGESFYNDQLDDTIAKMDSKGLIRESEGALVVDLSAYDLPTYLIRKSDGATLYQTRDIAAAKYRFERLHFDKMLYVVGSQQNLHFQQLFKVLELMGYDWVQDCVHVNFGTMRFKDGRMSTRRGNIVFLEDVLERAAELTRAIIEEKNPDLPDKDAVAWDVGMGAVIFADLNTRRIKDVAFDWDEVLNFDGETGPYLQYTHARFCSMLRKYGRPMTGEVDFSLLKEEYEWAVIRLLERFPSTIRSAAEYYEPAFVASYLINLATEANRFYNTCRVIGPDQALTEARIRLVYGVKTVLAKGLYLLGIKAPEQM